MTRLADDRVKPKLTQIVLYHDDLIWTCDTAMTNRDKGNWDLDLSLSLTIIYILGVISDQAADVMSAKPGAQRTLHNTRQAVP